MNRSELKYAAKQQIKGKIGTLFVIHLIIALVCCIPVAGFLLVPPLTISLAMTYANIARGGKTYVGELVCGLRVFGKAWLLHILMAFFTALWSLLFVIPGIVKGLSYSMAPFILGENHNMTAREALNESKRITEGHKGELFLLGLSFIGWSLLTFFTCGIVGIWAIPYMGATYGNFYQAIKTPVVEG